VVTYATAALCDLRAAVECFVDASDGGSTLQLLELSSSPLYTQQQPDKLILEFLVEVQFVSTSQL